jgi:hypothetical protein
LNKRPYGFQFTPFFAAIPAVRFGRLFCFARIAPPEPLAFAGEPLFLRLGRAWIYSALAGVHFDEFCTW